MYKKGIILFPFIIVLILFTQLAFAQGQLTPPPFPSHLIHGDPTIEGASLNGNETISAKLEKLLIIFIDSFDSQGTINAIIGGLNTASAAALSAEVNNLPYSIEEGINLPENANVENIVANEWKITGGGRVYTVIVDDINVWNGAAWVGGKKLEVFLHNGVIDRYIMGTYNTGEYVLEIPLSSDKVLVGTIGNQYILRDPLKAIPGDKVSFYIEGIRANNISSDDIIPGTSLHEVTEKPIVNVNIDAPDEIQFNIQLYAGLNIISIPVMPNDTSIEIILSDIWDDFNYAMSYDPLYNLRWHIYFKNTGGDLQDIQPGIGYIIVVDQDVMLEITGVPVENTVVPVYEGLNIVGYNSMNPEPINTAFNSIWNVFNYAMSYDPLYNLRWHIYFRATQSGDLQTIEPGVGYLIDMIQDGVLEVQWEGSE